MFSRAMLHSAFDQPRPTRSGGRSAMWVGLLNWSTTPSPRHGLGWVWTPPARVSVPFWKLLGKGRRGRKWALARGGGLLTKLRATILRECG